MNTRFIISLIFIVAPLFIGCESNVPASENEADCDKLVEIISTNTTNNGDGILIEVILKNEKRQYYKLIAPNELSLINYMDYYKNSSFGMYDYSDDLIIPKTINHANTDYTVTQISSRVCYMNSKITSLTIPSSVTYIGNEAFCECINLAKVIMGNNVTTIERGAFKGCVNLSSINLSKRIQSIAESLFMNCSNLNSINIPDGVSLIGSHAFYGCGKLQFVSIPFGVTRIENSAFYNCSSITTISIPNSVCLIENSAFEGCKSLNSVHVTDIASWCNITFTSNGANPLNYAHNLYINDNLITDLIIPENITSLRNWTFEGCSSLTSINIPTTISNIERYAFANCNNISSIIWNAQKCENFPIIHTYTPYEDSPFYLLRTQITSFVFGKSVKTIPNYLCYGMSHLMYIKNDSNTPQKLLSVDIQGVNFSECVLYVPDESVETYKTTEGWSNFGQIKPSSTF